MASRGFTLIELLVTLAVASILAVLVVPVWSTFWAGQQLSADVNTAPQRWLWRAARPSRKAAMLR